MPSPNRGRIRIDRRAEQPVESNPNSQRVEG